MPRFVASLTHPLAKITQAEKWFQLPVELPDPASGLLAGEMPAYISSEREDTVISPALAKRLGAAKERDRIELVLRQSHRSKINRIELSVVAHFAPPRWGDDFLLLGLDDLWPHFEIELLQKPQADDLLYLRALDPEKCIESQRL